MNKQIGDEHPHLRRGNTRRLTRRFGKEHARKATIATAHTRIRIAWAVMARIETYREDGGDYYDRRQAQHNQHLAVRYEKTLERLGYQVTLAPPDLDAPNRTDPDPIP
ncbi:hypothetical protein ACQEVF_40140 [Nonomuraea polychroma]|uniref:hypothetical protein n=1 Tax=Nonomuraea polychroma TaxID=46176 RepID=UPI003D8EBA29